MNPGNYNFTIFKGASVNLLAYYKDACGALIDLTGYSAKMECRYKLTDAEPFLTFDSGDGTIELGGTDGTIRLLQDADATAAIEDSGKGVYDLRLTAPDESASFLMQGNVTVKEMVTRDA